MGSYGMARTPATMMKMATTQAKIGLSMKKLGMLQSSILLGCGRFALGRRRSARVGSALVSRALVSRALVGSVLVGFDLVSFGLGRLRIGRIHRLGLRVPF